MNKVEALERLLSEGHDNTILRSGLDQSSSGLQSDAMSGQVIRIVSSQKWKPSSAQFSRAWAWTRCTESASSCSGFQIVPAQVAEQTRQHAAGIQRREDYHQGSVTLRKC